MNYPLGPIVSCINTATYNIAKFIVTIIDGTVSGDQYKVMDSFTFVRKLENITMPPGYILESMDVVRLFTNVPLDLVIDVIDKSCDQ